MAWESSLDSVIEVAISLVGFSGIVAVVGRRGAGQWSQADQLRLRILLTAGGSALAFAFLPFLLIDVIDYSRTWRTCSALLAVWMAGISIYRFRQTAMLGITKAVGYNIPLLILQLTAIIVLLANAFWFASSALYVLAVLWQTTVAFMTFVALLLEAWGEPADPTPPSK
jgi:hypothetical protein